MKIIGTKANGKKKRIGKNVKRRQWKKIPDKKSIFSNNQRKKNASYKSLMYVRLVNEKC